MRSLRAKSASESRADLHSQQGPKRPSLSPAVFTLVGACIGIWIATKAVIAQHFALSWMDTTPLKVLGTVVLCVAILLVVSVVLIHRSRLWLACTLGAAGILLGCISGFATAAHTLACEQTCTSHPLSSYQLLVTSDPTPSSTGGVRFYATVLNLSGRSQGRIWASMSSSQSLDNVVDNVRLGSILECVGRWSAFENDQWGQHMLAQGVCASTSLVKVHMTDAQSGPIGWIRTLRARLIDSSGQNPDEGIALTRGVTLGDQSAFTTTSSYTNFQNLGLSHLVAVSGSHLAVVASILTVALKRTKLGPRVRAAICLSMLIVYVILTGLQISAIRSVIMVGVALGATLVARRSHTVSSLVLSALGIVLVMPESLFSLGFQLSVASVAGIVLFGQLASCWLAALCGHRGNRQPGAIAQTLSLTLISQAFTAPITIPTFSTLPILSPLANAVVGPLMGALLPLGLACTTVATIIPACANLAWLPCRALGSLICVSVDLIARIPYACIPIQAQAYLLFLVLLVTALLVYMFWPQVQPKIARIVFVICCAVPLVVFLKCRFFAPERIVVLDVGQGDAILIQDGSRSLLVDTGPGATIVPALARLHVIHLDAVMLTHLDSDHTGGLDDLCGLVPMDYVIMADGVWDQMISADSHPDLVEVVERYAHKGAESVEAGDAMSIGDFLLSVVSPDAPVAGEENPDSIVAILSRTYSAEHAFTMLLTGDAESQTIEPLADREIIGDIDVLKVGHHGSAVSTTSHMLECLTPELAVVSAGKDNRYGHPTEVCQQTLKDNGVPLLCTIWSADIEIYPHQKGYRVICDN